jgi:hypothetical protein
MHRIFVIRMHAEKGIEQLLHVNTGLNASELRKQLVVHINQLLLNDFNRLVQILYRVDVSEKKLKELLHANPQMDAPVIIADLLIDRQQQKIKTRESFCSNDNIPEEEKW